MKKNNLKWYEAPQVEVVEMEVSASLLADSFNSSNIPNVDTEGEGGSE